MESSTRSSAKQGQASMDSILVLSTVNLAKSCNLGKVGIYPKEIRNPLMRPLAVNIHIFWINLPGVAARLSPEGLVNELQACTKEILYPPAVVAIRGSKSAK
jgi:hypothetical protein